MSDHSTPKADRNQRAANQKRYFALITAVIVILCIEGMSQLAIPLLSGQSLPFDTSKVEDLFAEQQRKMGIILANQGHTRLTLDDEIGWTYAPNISTKKFSSNEYAMRRKRWIPRTKRCKKG